MCVCGWTVRPPVEVCGSQCLFQFSHVIDGVSSLIFLLLSWKSLVFLRSLRSPPPPIFFLFCFVISL